MEEFTKEQKNYLADVYANGKSSSDVFREQHKADFIAGFEKALSLFAVSGRSEQCCSPTDGFYLGTTCPHCNKPFRKDIK